MFIIGKRTRKIAAEKARYLHKVESDLVQAKVNNGLQIDVINQLLRMAGVVEGDKPTRRDLIKKID